MKSQSQYSSSPSSVSLDEWFQERFAPHDRQVDLSLERMMKVKDNFPAFSVPIILVGGTNGKGSTCAYLEQIYRQAGYRVGSFISPHIVTVRERIRYNCSMLPEEVWYELSEQFFLKFSKFSLTFFEALTTLSFIFWQKYPVDVLIYEVGLGGRLDATNVLDADCSIITSIDIDHQSYLGSNRESIGFEKAGIFRKNKVAICGDLSPPKSVLKHANKIGADLCCLQKDFCVSWERIDTKQWCYSSHLGTWKALPVPSMRGRHQLRNASCALRAVQSLLDRLQVSLNDIRSALIKTIVPGRFQIIPGRPSVVVDIAHNPAGVSCLLDTLTDMPYTPNTMAVFSCLKDKDYKVMLEIMKNQICKWFVCEVPSLRSCLTSDIVGSLRVMGVSNSQIKICSDPILSYKEAYNSSSAEDRIVIFGSSYLAGCFLKAPSFAWHGL